MTSRHALVALTAVGLVMALLCFREAARRSLRGLELDGTITRVEVRTEKHPGRDDRFHVTVAEAGGERTVEVDARLTALLHEGATLRSGRDGVVVEGTTIDVSLAEEPVLLGLALLSGLVVGPLGAWLVQRLDTERSAATE